MKEFDNFIKNTELFDVALENIYSINLMGVQE